MPKKRHKPEEIVSKLRQADVLISQGQDIADVIRQIGVSEVTYYRWRQEYGGLKIEQVKRLKELETENTRLRKVVSDLTLSRPEADHCLRTLKRRFQDRNLPVICLLRKSTQESLRHAKTLGATVCMPAYVPPETVAALVSLGRSVNF